MTGKTRDYTGRQVDLEFLQTVTSTSGKTALSLTVADGTSRRVSGIQKAVQRYVALLLTPSDSVPFSDGDANTLIDAIRSGGVPNEGYLRHLFGIASMSAIDAMRKEDYNTELYGEQTDDERIAAVSLSGVTVDYETSTVSLSLVFSTDAGSDYSYVIPVST